MFIEITYGVICRFGRIGEARQSRGRRNHAIIIVWDMHSVAARIVARREPPAGSSVTLMVSGIANAMFEIDQDMTPVLSPIIGISILETARIEATEGIMAK